MRPVGSGSELITYTVKPGDTLYSISWRYGYDHREVAAWNNITPPFRIYVGQQLNIIPPYMKTARAAPHRNVHTRPSSSVNVHAAPVVSKPAVTSVTKPAVVASTSVPPAPRTIKPIPRHVTVEKPQAQHHNGKIDWYWPVKGSLRNRFDPSNGKKGLDIEGKMGQPILAAAGGTVVYSGNGLIGYGNLVIIKHDDNFLSAYGHNRRLLVKEGNAVKQGQKIAEMGDSGKQGVILHFEIRRDGKPVDPLRYLPK